MLEMEGLGFRNPRGDKSIALVGDAETALQRGSVGVLDISRTPNDKRILAIVDCFCERIADLEKYTLARLPLQREIQSVVDAARSAFVGVNGSQPRYRPLYVVNAGRIRAGHRGGGLPGGEGCNLVVRIEKDGAIVVVNRVLGNLRLWQIRVERAQEVDTVHVLVVDRSNDLVAEFPLQTQVCLLHVRCLKVGREGRNLGGEQAGDGGWRHTYQRPCRAIDQRIGIFRKYRSLRRDHVIEK